jgi:hypothetical protein
MAVRLSALSAGRVDSRAIVRLEGLSQLKKSNDLIGNRTRDLRACSASTNYATAPALVHYKITTFEISVPRVPIFSLEMFLETISLRKSLQLYDEWAPCEAYKTMKGEPGAWGYNWVTLSLGNINTGA